MAQGAVTIILILIGGQSALKVLQTASVAAAFPFMFIMLFMCFGVWKAMRQEMRPVPAEEKSFHLEAQNKQNENTAQAASIE